MNWKRGLARIYVVFWGIFALLGFSISLSAGDAIRAEGNRVAAFVEEHPGLDLRELRKLATAVFPSTADSIEVRFASATVVTTPHRLRTIARSAASERVTNPGMAHAKNWTGWLLVFVLVPGAVLLVMNWVISGFSRSN